MKPVLPLELEPLRDVAMRWGNRTRRDALRAAALQDPSELRQFCQQWTPRIEVLFEEYCDIRQTETSAAFLFTLLRADEINLRPAPPLMRRFDRTIADLATTGPAKAMARMYAARFLPVFGNRAKEALPLLRSALRDPAPQVRIAAHYACALLGESSLEAGRDRIAEIARDPTGASATVQRILPSLARWMMDGLDRDPAQHNIDALVSLAGCGDPEEVQRLLKTTDPNGLNSNDQKPALVAAVAECDISTTRLLIAAGAHVNLPWTTNHRTALHVAASRHRGPAILQVLLEATADPNVQDSQGRTALDLAVEYDLPINAQVLRVFQPSDRANQ